jgi:hypothetical protein
MNGPAWVSASLAVVMLLITMSCLARLALWRRSRPREPDVDGMHALMGIAMAGMLEPRLALVPASDWLVVFVIAAAWFTARAVGTRARATAGCRHWTNPALHAAECAVMLYMLLPARPARTTAMPGMAAPGLANPVLTVLLTVFMIGYIVWTADQFTSPAPGPKMSAGRKVVIGATMGYMLLTTL